MAVGAAEEKTASHDFRLLDGFEHVGEWKAGATEDSEASVSTTEGARGHALELSYEFRASGVAYARRALPLDLSNNFEMVFQVRGHAPKSTFEVKLLDESGANVWWKRFPDYEFPQNWTTIRIRRSDIGFAWGPIEDHDLKTIAKMEFVVVGASGDKASVEFDTLEIRTLPDLPLVLPPVVAKAGDALAPAAVDGNPMTIWTTGKATDLTLDRGYVGELGGLTLRWANGQSPEAMNVSLSEDGTSWTVPEWQRYVRPSSIGTTEYLRMAKAFGRYIRLSVTTVSGDRVGLLDATVEPPEFGQDDNRFLLALAKEAQKGSYPRSFLVSRFTGPLLACPVAAGQPCSRKTAPWNRDPGLFRLNRL
jgi:hypothetical protein